MESSAGNKRPITRDCLAAKRLVAHRDQQAGWRAVEQAEWRGRGAAGRGEEDAKWECGETVRWWVGGGASMAKTPVCANSKSQQSSQPSTNRLDCSSCPTRQRVTMFGSFQKGRQGAFLVGHNV